MNPYNTRFGERFLYVSVPKAACTTIKTYLHGIEGWPTGSVHEQGLRWGGEPLGDRLRFTFVRSPWDRIVSAYHSKIVRPDSEFAYVRKQLKQNTLFGFLTHIYDCGFEDDHWRPQLDLIDGVRYDFVGRVESFDLDFSFCMSKIGGPILYKYRVLNLTDYKGMTIENEATCKKMCRSLYREDLEELGYKI